eukprot:CAMPEP_0201654208 /NCGR_PEP_ID=MMETSP0493-20130528/45375_1 /ASSEMBLY_ACC=CAM_ASM_000838 /TAXON_ID=420259 /ORGANISM="Thalassiosira gravida, Strain GMp14c1" /LENGTH=537 /DNA_ID=CAMNT_0048130757 /DNA_START=477 /DNA_END=2090 /DNA_ORIENTATION=+
MDAATTSTSTGSTNSSAPPPGGGGGTTSSNGGTLSSSSGGAGFLNLGNLGTSPAVVGGMGLFSTGGGGGDGGLTSSSFGASLVANGFANDGSGQGGVTAGNPSFDLNDFPSLGGGVAGAVVSGSAGSDNGLAAALRQQQQLLQQQMMQQGGGNIGVNVGGIGIGGVGVSVGNAVNAANNADKSNVSNLYRLAMSSGIANGGIGGGPTGGAAGNNFNMTTEDFPALGASGGDGTGVAADGTTLVGAAAPSSNNGSGGGILDPTSNQLDYTGLIGSTGVTGATATSSGGIQQGGSSATTQTRPTSTSTSTTTQPGSSSSNVNTIVGGNTSSGNAGSGSGGGGAIGGDYGLLGLLSVIRMTDADRNRLALGSDLTVLGLNLNSPDVLYSTFGGPFSDKPATKEPHYQLPMCYYMQPPALKTGHLSKFQLETLFYIFYALPKDVLQAYSAQELYTREWRYHVESKLWFKRATANSTSETTGSGNGGTNSNSSSSSSPAVAPGQFIYFDINTWERRMYGNVNTNIAGGFLPEEDVRVKFPSS